MYNAGTSVDGRCLIFIPECDVCRSWSKEARDINTRYDGQREKRTKGPPPELSPSERPSPRRILSYGARVAVI